MTLVAICVVIPQRMGVSSTVVEIWRLKHNEVTTLNFWCHVTSSVTWPFDSRKLTSYGWSIVTMHLSGTVTEICSLKDNGVTTLTSWGHVTSSVTCIMTMRLSGTIMEIWSFEVLPGRLFLEKRSVVGFRSILNITLISYTPLRYVRNVAHKE